MCEKISVIIPVFNRERYIRECIDSILEQTYSNLEVIVVDDGSTDKSASLIQEYKKNVKYFYQENAGSGKAKNSGVVQATGEYLSFLDSDDIWSKEKTELQLAIIKKKPGIEMVFGYAIQFISSELSKEEKGKIHCPEEKMAGYNVGTMLISKANFLKTGFFPEHLKVGEFVEWYSRAMSLGYKSELIPEVVLRRRIHKTNQSILQNNDRSDFNKILKGFLDRKKNNPII